MNPKFTTSKWSVTFNIILYFVGTMSSEKQRHKTRSCDPKCLNHPLEFFSPFSNRCNVSFTPSACSMGTKSQSLKKNNNTILVILLRIHNFKVTEGKLGIRTPAGG